MGDRARDALMRMVVGQTQAMVSLSRLIDMHLSWFDMKEDLDDIGGPSNRSPNALIIGPTGTGKTHAIKVAAKALNIPYVIIDSTRLVPTGDGDHLTLEDVLRNLVKSARQRSDTVDAEDVAERGIVFLDEFDKLRYKEQTDATAGVQRRLLQFIEGDTLDLGLGETGRRRELSTQNILFIAAGAFSKINETIAKRQVGEGSYSVDVIHARDVQRYGFLEELVARLPVIIRLKPLGADELRGILVHPDVSPMKFYEKYFERNGFKLTLLEETKNVLAEDAAKSKLGARGLHQELFPVLNALADVLIKTSVEDAPATDLTPIDISRTDYRALKAGHYREGTT